MSAPSRIGALYPRNSDADIGKQTIEVPGTGGPGESPVYRGSLFPFMTLETPGAFTNLVDLFDEGLRRSEGGPFLGYRPLLSKKPPTFADYYEWQTWPEVDARRRAVGSAVHRMFQARELVGGELDTVGLWSKNSPSWFIVDLAMQAYGKVTVALYDTLGDDSVEYMVNHAELSIIFATTDHIPFLLNRAQNFPQLKVVVALDTMEDGERKILAYLAKDKGVKLMDMDELEAYGKANPTDVIRPDTHSIAAICYTSGTSGQPKGAMLSHANFAMSVYAYLHFSSYVDPQRTAMSFLPLAHVYQRIMDLCCVAVGKRIGFPSGDPTRFLEDMQLLKPHFVALVPRVLNRLYSSANAASDAPGLKGALFRRAAATKLQNLEQSGRLTHPVWDWLVFRKINGVLGGRVTKVASGSAPLGKHVVDFIKVGALVDLCEGYGMTENTGCCATVWEYDPGSGGAVGPLMPVVEGKLVDVPELGYRVTDKPFPRGELLMRGASRFMGYYKDEGKTREAIDADGWLHTGDVATLDGAGRFRIVDRVKNIMKLAQGEYVALEAVENAYAASPLIAQVFVHGDGLRHFLVGVVVPDPAQLATLAGRVLGRAVDAGDSGALEACVRDPAVCAAVYKELEKEESVKKLKGFEKVKRMHVTLDAGTIENGCITPTFKIRRKAMYEKFRIEIDGLYAEPDPVAPKRL